MSTHSSQEDKILDYKEIKLKKKLQEIEIRGIKEKKKVLEICEGLEIIGPEGQEDQDFFFKKYGNCNFLIVVTMFDEDSDHFRNTIIGITENLQQFEENKVKAETITCIVIVDGKDKFLENFSKNSKFYQEYVIQEKLEKRFNSNNGKDDKDDDINDEFAQCFMQKQNFGGSMYQLNLIFCIKQKNRRKLNSHLWFFGGFCEMIKPKYVMLIDVGTKPLSGSLYALYKAMEDDEMVAGCCGEIKPNNYDIWKIVVPAQVVEYKLSHILDKALESVCGFITVLPGAFSAYRWEALKGDPLWVDYFKPFCRKHEMNAFQSNIYLAEDRVLCLALFCKKDSNNILRYVRKSVAETDVPDTIANLIAQRRRWINGSMFASINSLNCKNCLKIRHSNHNCCRKSIFLCQILYFLINIIYSWFIVGALALTLAIAIRNSNEATSGSFTIGNFLMIFYTVILIILLTMSLSVNSKATQDFYKIITTILAAYQFIVLFLILKYILTNITLYYNELVFIGSITLLSCFGFIIIANWEIVTILKGSLHFIIMIPTYVNVFIIYSICNTHDCTWGNRPDKPTKDEEEKLDDFKKFRTIVTMLWILSNSGFAYGMNWITKSDNPAGPYFIVIVGLTGIGILFVRVLGGLIYICCEICKERNSCCRCCDKKSNKIHPGNEPNRGDIHSNTLLINDIT